MDKQRKYSMASANGYGKQFIDDEIGKEVLESIPPAEENAQDRKMIYAIWQALDKAGIPLPAEITAEFEKYNSKVEKIKEETKKDLGV